MRTALCALTVTPSLARVHTGSKELQACTMTYQACWESTKLRRKFTSVKTTQHPRFQIAYCKRCSPDSTSWFPPSKKLHKDLNNGYGIIIRLYKPNKKSGSVVVLDLQGFLFSPGSLRGGGCQFLPRECWEMEFVSDWLICWLFFF